LIDGIFRLATSSEHGPMNIGNPVEMTILQLAEAILELTGSGSEIIRKPLPVDDPKVRQPDIGLAMEKLGWAPKMSLREGLPSVIDYFKSANR
jgi:nucleoside-diphosphate-sugar epimerase